MRDFAWILPRVLVATATFTFAGCTDDPPDDSLASGSETTQNGDGDGDGDGDEEPNVCDASIEPGPAPIRRLTRVEYNNTVYQLLGDTSYPANAFPLDEEANGFDNQAEALVVSPLLAEQHLAAAEKLAAAHSATLLEDLPACLGANVDPDACTADAETFVRSFGKRAFRRPLTEDEVAVHLDLFIQGTALGEQVYEPQVGLEIVLEALLQSPHFLYRVEFGGANPDDADVVPLNAYEIASRLSYLLWNTMPDGTLFAAADADELQTPAQIEAQARRMMGTPRARQAVKNFHRQWLGLDEVEPLLSANGKDTQVYPDFNSDLLALWVQETETFLDDAVFVQDANVELLFTADYSMMNQELAEFYGIGGVTGPEFVRVELDPAIYSGFLTHASLLALYAKTDRSSPIHRGKFVRSTLLCQPPPAPPPNIPELPEVDETQTTREQFEQHASDPACAGCHFLMDPIGFGFEHFDGVGRYRATEHGGLGIDATGNLWQTDVEETFDGVDELGQRLASSDDVKKCVATQWFRFGYGRSNTLEDACSIAEIQAIFAAADYDIKELVIALTQTDAFRYRYAVTGETP